MPTAGVLLALLAGSGFAGDPGEARYQVRVEADAPRRAAVEARLNPGPRGLCLDRAALDTGIPGGWARFVTDLEVRDDAGVPRMATPDGTGCWRIDVPGPVTANYTVLLQHDQVPNDPGDDELAYAGDWGQFWTGRALFLEGAPADSVAVAFELPEGWAVTAPWPAAGDGSLEFRPGDMDALLDNGFMLGTHRALVFDEGRTTVHIGLVGPGPRGRADELAGTLRRSLAGFGRLHRASPEGDVAVFLGQGRVLGGGVVGRTISMLVVDDVPDEVLPMLDYLVTHEAFHLWNADLGYVSKQDMYWFSEGFAEYYTALALHAQGSFDDEALLGQIAERAALYRAAAGDQSMVEAGKRKLEHYDLVYSGGMMAALALDMAIMQASGGRHRLADALPAVYARYGPGRQPGLDPESLATLIHEETGVDVSGLLRSSVQGTEPLATDELRQRLAETLRPRGDAAGAPDRAGS